MNPASHLIPPFAMARSSSLSGSNLARANAQCAGHFFFAGLVPLGEAADQFRAHDTDGHQPLRLGNGAAGLVLRIALPRPSIASEVDDLTHATRSLGSSSRKREPNEEQFSCVQKLVAG